MLKDDWVYVGHMLDMGKQALEIAAGIDKAAYDADITLRLAITHLVQRIGEAAQRVSTPFRESHPEIPWREIVGMRNRIVHDYLNVDEDIVWQVVRRDIPSLVTVLQKIIPEEYL